MGLENLWVLKFVGTQSLWTLKHCEYSKFVGTPLVFCGYSKFVGSKIEGIQFFGYSNSVVLLLSNMKSNKKNRTWVLSKNKKIQPFFI